MYTVYTLISQSKNWIYVGMTSDINDRISRHQNGYERTTKPYRPFSVLLLASAFNRHEARRLEKWYKTAYGKSVIREFLTFLKQQGDTGLSTDR